LLAIKEKSCRETGRFSEITSGLQNVAFSPPFYLLKLSLENLSPIRYS
jgi:hypothetical protein